MLLYNHRCCIFSFLLLINDTHKELQKTVKMQVTRQDSMGRGLNESRDSKFTAKNWPCYKND